MITSVLVTNVGDRFWWPTAKKSPTLRERSLPWKSKTSPKWSYYSCETLVILTWSIQSLQVFCNALLDIFHVWGFSIYWKWFLCSTKGLFHLQDWRVLERGSRDWKLKDSWSKPFRVRIISSGECGLPMQILKEMF